MLTVLIYYTRHRYLQSLRSTLTLLYAGRARQNNPTLLLAPSKDYAQVLLKNLQ